MKPVDPWTFGVACLVSLVAGVFVAAALGGWLERRKRGRRPFIVNHYMEPITQDELEHLLYEAHQEQKGHRLQ